jgi:hypothetical protein
VRFVFLRKDRQERHRPPEQCRPDGQGSGENGPLRPGREVVVAEARRDVGVLEPLDERLGQGGSPC